MRYLRPAILLSAVMSSVSCSEEAVSSFVLRLNQVSSSDAGDVSGIYRVCQYESSDGKYIKSDFIGSGRSTVTISGTPTDVIVYNFALEFVTVTCEGSEDEAAATVSGVTVDENYLGEVLGAAPPEPVMNMPDLLYVGKASGLDAGVLSAGGGEYVISCPLLTQRRLFTISGVSGIENVSSVILYVTGMTPGVLLHSGGALGDEVMMRTECGYDSSTGTLKAYFDSFGRCPSSPDVRVYIIVVDTAGGLYAFEEDITRQFDRGDGVSLKINCTVEEPETGSGGFLPTIDDWTDVDVPVIVGQ